MSQGRLEEALPLLQKGTDAYRAAGAEVALPYYLSILGTAKMQARQFEDARQALDEGLAFTEKNDERFQEAELHRLQGELLNATPLTDTDPITGASVTFTDLTTNQPDTLQANLIFPEPCEFISSTLPACAVIRPTAEQSDAVDAIQAFIQDGLFIGQPDAFTQLLFNMAAAADRAGG